MKKIIASFSFAFNGIWYAFRNELNFRIHMLFSVMVTIAAWALQISSHEWLVILLSIALVASMELINTAIEKLCDVVHPEQHPKIKIVKDAAAGAVLIAAIIAVICGVVVFLPKIISLL